MSNRKNSSGSSLMTKAGIFAALMGVAYMAFQFLGADLPNDEVVTTSSPSPSAPTEQQEETTTTPTKQLVYLPTPADGQVVQHTYMTICYNEKHEQANWVAYELTKDQVRTVNAERDESFQPDQAITTGSASPSDYRGSGFDRGHLCPAADRHFNQAAMSETFLMSNMSPQIPTFNRGIWRELEESVRDWAYKYKDLYIITGPILSKKPMGVLGKSEVSIPVSFYKIIYDKTNKKGIAFLIPNDVSDIPLSDFAVSIDKAEQVTKLDFFPKLWSEDDNNVEDEVDLAHFRFDEKRFQQRVSLWNTK